MPQNSSSLRGGTLFAQMGCAGCHTPPFYTNNKLAPASGFTVPEDHRKNYDILNVEIGTDPGLTLRTRRGTGYYKVPSLQGVWYRGAMQSEVYHAPDRPKIAIRPHLALKCLQQTFVDRIATPFSLIMCRTGSYRFS